jgi:hypothetical protein
MHEKGDDKLLAHDAPQTEWEKTGGNGSPRFEVYFVYLDLAEGQMNMQDDIR